MLSLFFKGNNSLSKSLFCGNYIRKNLSYKEKDYSGVNSIILYSFCRKKKVIQLKPSTIKIQEDDSIEPLYNESPSKLLELKRKVMQLPWQEMAFDQLCSLQPQILEVLEMEMMKDKFNVSDQKFLEGFSLERKVLASYKDLEKSYKKNYCLLMNTNEYYEQFPITQQFKKGYLNQMYVTDLKNDEELKTTISRFIKHINKPQRLENLAEPSFVKHLLGLKRELMLLGIHFETKAEKKQAIQSGQRVLSHEKQQLPKVQILDVLNYEYEFWQDVKHNRAKNGSEDLFVIEEKEIPNPNTSVLLKELYPTIRMKYIVRKKKAKIRERCFCQKADLLIEIEGRMRRRIKVEWKGVSNKKENEKVGHKKAKENGEEQWVPRVDYMIIDYEDLMDGNPTIKPVFSF